MMHQQDHSSEIPNLRYLRFLSLGKLLVAMMCLTGCEYPADGVSNNRFDPAVSDNLIWGRRGLDNGRFIKPRAIAIDRRDQLYIVDMTSRIQVFDRDGKFLRSWRTPECQQGKPCGLSFSQDGQLMVCDTHYFRVLFYSPDGQLDKSRTIGGTNGRGPGEFGFVTDAVQDSRGNYYVSEYGDYDRIQMFSPGGEFICQWGQHGTEPGAFLRPQGMVMDENDRLYVADASNHRVQIFDCSITPPEYAGQWGEAGRDAGELSFPYQLVVDGPSIYVCEFGNHRIQKFTLGGQHIGTWGSAGRQPGQLHQPWALAMDSTGALHVVDSYNDRVQRFTWPEDQPLVVDRSSEMDNSDSVDAIDSP